MIDEAKKQGFKHKRKHGNSKESIVLISSLLSEDDTSSLLTNVYHKCLEWKKEKHCKKWTVVLITSVSWLCSLFIFRLKFQKMLTMLFTVWNYRICGGGIPCCQ